MSWRSCRLRDLCPTYSSGQFSVPRGVAFSISATQLQRRDPPPLWTRPPSYLRTVAVFADPMCRSSGDGGDQAHFQPNTIRLNAGVWLRSAEISKRKATGSDRQQVAPGHKAAPTTRDDLVLTRVRNTTHHYIRRLFSCSWTLEDTKSLSFGGMRLFARDMGPKKLRSSDAYTIGFIYVKPLEMNAITVMLDEEYQSVPLALGDKNEYTLGRIGKHNVAIVGPARGGQGKVAVADVVGSTHRTQPVGHFEET